MGARRPGGKNLEKNRPRFGAVVCEFNDTRLSCYRKNFLANNINTAVFFLTLKIGCDKIIPKIV